jgi:signal transduction histidine kinase
MNIRRMSLQFRLALLFSAVLALAFGAFGAAAHVAVAEAARDEMERTLADEAQQLVASRALTPAYAANGIGLADEDVTGEGAYLDQSKSASQFASLQLFRADCSLGGGLRHVRYLIRIGEVLPLSDAGLSALKQGQVWIEFYQFEDDSLLVYTQPIVDQDHLVGVAQVARPFTEHERTLATLRNLLLFGGGAATITAFGLAWGLTGRSLRPLSRMARTAQTIGAHRDFNVRLEKPAFNDEVGRLSASLNGMLNELQDAYQQVESSVEAQRNLIADVSHELRAPLATVRGNLGLLQREPSIADEDRRAALRDAVDEIERMSRLVNELLLLARTNATPSLRLEPIDLAALVESMLRKTAVLAREHILIYEKQAGVDESVIVQANVDALNQVLLILLDNAVKYTPHGGRITLEIGVDVDSGGGWAHIRVRDTGLGIPPEALPHVFDRHYRAGVAQTGYGLGLFIAKSLIEAQGGTIGVASKPGHGSTFTISLPLLDR